MHQVSGWFNGYLDDHVAESKRAGDPLKAQEAGYGMEYNQTQSDHAVADHRYQQALRKLILRASD